MITSNLTSIADSSRRGLNVVFSDFLTYIITFFTPDPQPLASWPYSKQQNTLFFSALYDLTQAYQSGISAHGWCDPLGDTYMSLLSKSDTSRNGVFFTPASIASLMANLCASPATSGSPFPCGAFGSRSLCSDPTCGSGRNLLAVASKYANRPLSTLPYFIGEDINADCVRMTAINLMAHGLPGEVICHNTLSEPDSLQFGFIINEGLFPVSSGLPTIRRFTDPLRFVLFRSRRTHHAH